jgi:hypothetical protein
MQAGKAIKALAKTAVEMCGAQLRVLFECAGMQASCGSQ